MSQKVRLKFHLHHQLILLKILANKVINEPIINGTSSALVLSGPKAAAIVPRFFTEFTLLRMSSDFNSSIKIAML